MKTLYRFFRACALAVLVSPMWLPLCSAAAQPFFFIQLTDPQFGMFSTNADFVQETANFEFAVATINRLHPAFVVVTGDLVNRSGDAAQIAEYKRIQAKIAGDISVYNVAGNHDVGNMPTPQTVAAYTNAFGPDHYSFHYGDFVGLVLDSSLIHSPEKAPHLSAEQENWLKAELEKFRKGPGPIMVFQHHPWFLKSATETNQYFNLPRESRARFLPLFHEAGVKYVFCGHYHQNALARDGDLEIVTTAPVGKPLGGAKSGLCVVVISDNGISHHFYDFAELPERITLPASRATTP